MGVPVPGPEYHALMGWEEAPVEYLQRRIRPEVMARLGVTYDEEHTRQIEQDWLYNPYLAAYENILRGTGADGRTLSIELMGQPIAGRAAFVMRRYVKQALLVSVESARLKANLMGGTMSQEAEDRLILEEDR